MHRQVHETPHHVAPTALVGLPSEKQHFDGWSPSKIESLNFFLASTAKKAPSTALTTAAVPQPHAPASGGFSTMAPAGGEAQRPYLGLKYLLRSGPGGSDAPKTWVDLQTEQEKQKPARLLPGRVTSGSGTSRFAPYSMPPPRAARNR